MHPNLTQNDLKTAKWNFWRGHKKKTPHGMNVMFWHNQALCISTGSSTSNRLRSTFIFTTDKGHLYKISCVFCFLAVLDCPIHLNSTQNVCESLKMHTEYIFFKFLFALILRVILIYFYKDKACGNNEEIMLLMGLDLAERSHLNTAQDLTGLIRTELKTNENNPKIIGR